MKRQASTASKVVRAGRSKSAGGRVRFSVTAREAAVAHSRAREKEGASLMAAASELGVEYQTLRRWSGQASLAFRPVSVLAPAPARELAVLLPGGVRVEGLGIEDVVELSRLLR